MSSTLIIAEAGVNYNGRLDLAYRMVDEAKKAGADIVKFQTGVPEKVMSRFAEKAEYQKQTTGAGESQLEMVRKLLDLNIPIFFEKENINTSAMDSEL